MVVYMQATRGGRPAAPGPRYDCGRRKPAGDPRGAAAWNRLKSDPQLAVKLLLDPAIATQLSRLGPTFLGELTERQVDAGLLVARIYGEYERHHALCRTTRSPSYERSFGNSDAAEDRLDPESLTRLERRIRKARKRWERLQQCFEVLPPAPRRIVQSAVERLCVEDRAVSSFELNHVAPMLSYIADSFQIGTRETRRSVAVTTKMPPRRREPKGARPDPYRDAFLDALRHAKPDATPDELRVAWEAYRADTAMRRAVVDRTRFRQDKRRGAR
jgi:hypothetical protein